jgi:hypothetical protein
MPTQPLPSVNQAIRTRRHSTRPYCAVHLASTSDTDVRSLQTTTSRSEKVRQWSKPIDIINKRCEYERVALTDRKMAETLPATDKNRPNRVSVAGGSNQKTPPDCRSTPSVASRAPKCLATEPNDASDATVDDQSASAACPMHDFPLVSATIQCNLQM